MRVLVPPAETVSGLAVNDVITGSASKTMTKTLATSNPASAESPVAMRVYCVVVVGNTVVVPPAAGATAPTPGVMVTAVALAVLHDKSTLCPEVMVVTLAVKDMICA